MRRHSVIRLMAVLALGAVIGCSANTNVICALAPYLPFNIAACAPSATPTPAK